jgi:uncharacterized protein YlaI
MEKTYKCPDCGYKLTEHTSCGAESYFCDSCKSLKSRSRIKGHSNYIKPVVD